jgi:hypothetical protein
VHDLGQEELLDRADLVVDGTNRERDGVALVVRVDAEAADAGDLVGEVRVAQLSNACPALLVVLP